MARAAIRSSSLDLLRKTAWLQCSNPLDKFYALTSLFAERPPAGLEIDYTRTKRDVYLRLTAFLLRSGQGTALYEACGLRDSSSLPSWVVDWTELASRSFTDVSGRHVLDVDVRKCYSDWWFVFDEPEMGRVGHISGSVLTLPGRKVAVVESVQARSADEILGVRMLRGGTFRHYRKGERVPMSDYDKRGTVCHPDPHHASRYWWRRERDEVEAGDSIRYITDRVWRAGSCEWHVPETKVGHCICCFEGFEYPFVLEEVAGQQWTIVKACRTLYHEMTEFGTDWQSFPGMSEGPTESFEII